MISIMTVLMISFTAAMASDMSKNSELTQRIDDIFGAVYNNPDEPGAAVLIMQGGDTLYSRCFGLADMETREPVTLETNFCIASVSKQFSAVALLQLAEQGAVSLDDPLSRFFPEFQAPFFRDITLHHIMSHTSGIPDARPRDDRNFVLYSNDVTSVQYMRMLDHLNFQPGTQYEYINPTFQLIYQIVERVTGTPFETYMQEHVFDKAGMMTCRYYEPDRSIAHMAHGYVRDDKGVWQEYDYGEESFFGTKADGALYCSVNDFVRWERALRDNRVWTASSKRLAYQPWIQIPADAEYGYQPYTGYGYGFFVQDIPGRPTHVYHLGDNGGFTIYAGKIPERDLIFLFFSTRPDIDRLRMVNQVYQILEQ
ncbi:MAG: beta-lactamase family protein [Muribaculaceae bacterium]|nr:beta-lactamase family protein [Muribaculaceae bacterium]